MKRVKLLGSWILTGLSIGLGVFLASCAMDETDLGLGACKKAADDGNPCTYEGCSGTSQEHVVQPGALCDNGLACDSNGQCVVCNSAAQCGTETFCMKPSCDMKTTMCVFAFTAENKALPQAEQKANDCANIVCDGFGGTRLDLDPTDKLGEDVCQVRTCTVAGTMAMPLMMVAGEHCNGVANKVCTGSGMGMDACVGCIEDKNCEGADAHEMHCNSGMHTCINCMTECSPLCTAKCNGTACAKAVDCASENCVDGYCCTSSCNGACKSCAIAGKEGQCSNVVEGGEDAPKCLHEVLLTCATGGVCLYMAGHACMDPGDCPSNSCVNGKCVGQ